MISIVVSPLIQPCNAATASNYVQQGCNVASDVFSAHKKAVSKQNSASVTAYISGEGYSKTQRGRGAGYLAPTALYATFLGMT